MPKVSIVAVSRRVLFVAIIALIAALAVSVSVPSEAQAVRDPRVVFPHHKGWVKVNDGLRACPMIYPTPSYCYQPAQVPAWRWTGRYWNATTITGGTWVYAHPYSGDWHWIWTQRTGWLAIKRTNLNTGYSCTGSHCPQF